MVLNQISKSSTPAGSIATIPASLESEHPPMLDFCFRVGKNEGKGFFTLDTSINAILEFTLTGLNGEIQSLDAREVVRIKVENKNYSLLVDVRDGFANFTTLKFELEKKLLLSSLLPEATYVLKGTYEHFFDVGQISAEVSGVVTRRSVPYPKATAN